MSFVLFFKCINIVIIIIMMIFMKTPVIFLGTAWIWFECRGNLLVIHCRYFMCYWKHEKKFLIVLESYSQSVECLLNENNNKWKSLKICHTPCWVLGVFSYIYLFVFSSVHLIQLNLCPEVIGVVVNHLINLGNFGFDTNIRRFSLFS